MKSIVIANQKGGVGKTACIVNLAFYFLKKNKRVAVIDFDPQGNATYTLNEIATTVSDSANLILEKEISQTSLEGNLILIPSDNKLADRKNLDGLEMLKNNLSILSQNGIDVVLIDTPPTLGNGLVMALLTADYVLSPIELEAYSIQGISLMLKLIKNLSAKNPKLRFLGMVVSKFDARNPRQVANLKEITAVWPNFVLNEKIGLRTSIAESLAAKIPVWKIRKTAARKAAQEIMAVGNSVAMKIGMTE